MARRRTITAAILNIRLQRQYEGQYQELLQAAFDLGLPIRVRGDTYLLISSLNRQVRDGYLEGRIAKFTEIDVDGAWFNLTERREAGNEERQEITIPHDLRPNYKSYVFLFRVDQHRLYFEVYGTGGSLSPFMVKTLFEGLFAHPRILRQFNQVTVDLVQSRSSLDEIWNLEILKHLIITIKPPNADDGDDLEEEIQSRLERQHGSRYVEDWKARKGESFTPDERTRALAEVAIENGEVEAEGINEDGHSIAISTQRTPAKGSFRYNPEELNETTALRRAIPNIE